MKYIKLQLPMGSDGICQEIFVAMSNFVVHSDLAEAMQKMPGLEKAVVVTAGEINVEASSTHGWSSSLGLEADPADAGSFNLNDYFSIKDLESPRVRPDKV
jgi:hypothetical protein